MNPSSDDRRVLAEPKCLEDRELAAVWEGLELPPPDPAPIGYVDQVVAHCRATEAGPLPLSPWTRAAAWTALVLGAWLGQGLAIAPAATSGPLEHGPTVVELGDARPVVDPALGPMVPSLAEVYWSFESDPLGEEEEPRETEERR